MDSMIIHQEKDHHVRVQNNVSYLNSFEIGSRMTYFWFSYGRLSSRVVSHENLGL